MLFGTWTRVANTTETSLCSDAALRQITLTTCYFAHGLTKFITL